MKPELSICIPTYNRSSSLEALLKKIISLKSNHNIEIIVSNNCSTDNTDFICKKIKEQEKNFKYIRQKENLGFALNVEAVIKEANGKYLWLLGDDDLLLDDSLELIMANIQASQSGWLIFNFIKDGKKLFKIPKNSKLFSLDSCLYSLGIWSSFMSISVLRKDAMTNIEEVKKNNYFAFSLSLKAGAEKGVEFIDSCIVIRKKDDISKHRFNEINTYAIDFFEYLDGLVKEKQIKQKTRNQLANQFFFGIISVYAIKNKLSSKDLEEFWRIYRVHKKVLGFYFTLLPIYFFPRRIIIFFLRMVIMLNLVIRSSKIRNITNYLLNND